MKITLQTNREFIRKTVLKFLAERFRLAFEPDQIEHIIRRRTLVDFDIDVEDVRLALEVLLGMGLIEIVIEKLGATKYYKITAQGIIENERIES